MSMSLPMLLRALIAKTKAPLFVGVPVSLAVAGSKLKPSGKPRVSNELLQVRANVTQSGIVVESTFKSKVAAGYEEAVKVKSGRAVPTRIGLVTRLTD